MAQDRAIRKSVHGRGCGSDGMMAADYAGSMGWANEICCVDGSKTGDGGEVQRPESAGSTTAGWRFPGPIGEWMDRWGNPRFIGSGILA